MILRPNRGATAQAFTFPAPTGGWNTRDPLNAMAPNDAVVLDNMFPLPKSVKLRKGWQTHCGGSLQLATEGGDGLATEDGDALYTDGPTDAVETIITYNAGATREMFAALGGAIYDATTAGIYPEAEVSSLSNARWQWVNFGTSGGSFVIAVNGEDTPLKYDGSSWATTSLTGASGALTNIAVHKRRLFLCENGTLKFWYPAVESIAGSMNSFDLSPLMTRGGYLMAIGSLSIDSGDGLDDLFVAVSSEGEAVIYAGSNPSDATDWLLKGRYFIGAPLGRRCMTKHGGDLVIATVNGYFPLSKMVSVDPSQALMVALSSKIDPAVTDVTMTKRTNFGWQPIVYPLGTMLLVNVPIQENGTAHQHAMNTVTGAWCRFTGMDASCWGLHRDLLYFGGPDGTVCQAFADTSDDGSNVEGDCKPAFSNCGIPSRYKMFTLVRPSFVATGDVVYQHQLNKDFEDTAPVSIPTSQAGEGAVWDQSEWDTTPWSDSARVVQKFAGTSGRAIWASPRIAISARNIEVEINTIDLFFRPVGPM